MAPFKAASPGHDISRCGVTFPLAEGSMVAYQCLVSVIQEDKMTFHSERHCRQSRGEAEGGAG